MAFMVPLVKNHYDIYARNNPADHHADANSLYLSATSLKSGAPVKKQYRIILTGGKVAGGKKATSGGKNPGLTQTNGKLYYRMPSASISLPIQQSINGRVIPKKSLTPPAASGGNSPTSVNSPSRPLPHVKRTVRNPLNNRVYSYSVSIPDYVEEEPEEASDLDVDMDPEDKENLDEHLLLFSTSAPAGTGPIESETPSPLPTTKGGPGSKKVKKPVQASISLPTTPDGSIKVPSTTRHPPIRTHSSTSNSSTEATPPASTNSREYVELLRKFILHLKMLKIGGKSKKTTATARPKEVPVPVVQPETANANDEQKSRARKRKDTMEDCKHL